MSSTKMTETPSDPNVAPCLRHLSSVLANMSSMSGGRLPPTRGTSCARFQGFRSSRERTTVANSSWRLIADLLESFAALIETPSRSALSNVCVASKAK